MTAMWAKQTTMVGLESRLAGHPKAGRVLAVQSESWHQHRHLLRRHVPWLTPDARHVMGRCIM